MYRVEYKYESDWRTIVILSCKYVEMRASHIIHHIGLIGDGDGLDLLGKDYVIVNLDASEEQIKNNPIFTPYFIRKIISLSREYIRNNNINFLINE